MKARALSLPRQPVSSVVEGGLVDRYPSSRCSHATRYPGCDPLVLMNDEDRLSHGRSATSRITREH